MHRYTFPLSSKKPLLKINLKQGIGWDKVTECQLTQENSTTMSGHHYPEGWAKGQCIYFFAEFSQPLKLKGMQGDSVGASSIGQNMKPLPARVGTSTVSVDNAKANLCAEIKDWDFD